MGGRPYHCCMPFRLHSDVRDGPCTLVAIRLLLDQRAHDSCWHGADQYGRYGLSLAQRHRIESWTTEKHANELSNCDKASPLLGEHGSLENGVESKEVQRMEGDKATGTERPNRTSKS